jgi:hypothetical protein
MAIGPPVPAGRPKARTHRTSVDLLLLKRVVVVIVPARNLCKPEQDQRSVARVGLLAGYSIEQREIPRAKPVFRVLLLGTCVCPRPDCGPPAPSSSGYRARFIRIPIAGRAVASSSAGTSWLEAFGGNVAAQTGSAMAAARNFAVKRMAPTVHRDRLPGANARGVKCGDSRKAPLCVIQNLAHA